MGERFRTRALVARHAVLSRLRPRRAGGEIRRVLVAHNLLLGDTIMLAPLLAKLRAVHPAAEVTLLAQPAFVPLFAGRPYGARALAFRPSDSATARALVDTGPYDLAFVAGDNRYGWLAAAMGSAHIVGHAGDHPASKDWFSDELRPYGSRPAAWGDLVADLVDGPEPAPYARGDWPGPAADLAWKPPEAPYAVLHVGGSTPLKHWLPERWKALAAALEGRGLVPVWSAGPGEEGVARAADPEGRYPSCAGTLDLSQLWHVVAGARLLVAPDTGIAHLGRLTWTPTVALFGPGSEVLAGKGRFWRETPWRAVGRETFPCRDQRLLFRRELDWVRRCGRTTDACPAPRCMHAIELEEVVAAVRELDAAVPIFPP